MAETVLPSENTAFEKLLTGKSAAPPIGVTANAAANNSAAPVKLECAAAISERIIAVTGMTFRGGKLTPEEFLKLSHEDRMQFSRLGGRIATFKGGK